MWDFQTKFQLLINLMTKIQALTDTCPIHTLNLARVISRQNQNYLCMNKYRNIIYLKSLIHYLGL